MAGGHVSIRNWRRRVDLASKIKRKTVKKLAKNPIDDTLAWPLPQRRNLEMNKPAKTKEKQRKTDKQSHHSPKRLGDGQPPLDLVGRK
jgi:hypothetical protein